MAKAKAIDKNIKVIKAPPKDGPPPQKGKGDGKKKGGKKGKHKGKKGSKKGNLKKKMRIFFFINGMPDIQPLRERVTRNMLKHIVERNLHDEWEYRGRFVHHVDGRPLKTLEEVHRSMPLVLVRRPENFVHAEYKHNFIKYMQDISRDIKLSRQKSKAWVI